MTTTVLIKYEGGREVDALSVPSQQIALLTRKRITLQGAMDDFYGFCAQYELDASIHDSAWTDTRLGAQKISAYDIYNVMDELKAAMVRKRMGRLENSTMETLMSKDKPKKEVKKPKKEIKDKRPSEYKAALGKK